MTQLAENRNTRERLGLKYGPLILNDEIMFAGGLAAVLGSTGEAEMASDKAGLIVLGRSELYVDNSADGERADIQAGIFLMNNSLGNPVTTAYVKKICYIEDDNTVSIDPGTNGIIAGAVIEVTSEGVWVDTTNNIAAVPAAANVVCADMTTDLTGVDTGTDMTAAQAAQIEADLTALKACIDALNAALEAAGLMLSA